MAASVLRTIAAREAKAASPLSCCIEKQWRRIYLGGGTNGSVAGWRENEGYFDRTIGQKRVDSLFRCCIGGPPILYNYAGSFNDSEA